MSPSRIVVLIILIGYAWRVQGLTDQSLWRDEVDAIYFALRELPATLSMFTAAAQNGPLYFLSLRPWLRLVGSGEFALRYPSTMAGVIALPLYWQVSRILLQSVHQSGHVDRFLTVTSPLIAVFFLAVNPYQIWYSQEGKMYALVVAFALLASWLWLRGIERREARYWIGYFGITSLSFYVHLLMILLIPLHMLWFVIAWPQSRFAWRGYAAALAGLTLPYLPMIWWQWHMLTASAKLTGYNYTPFTDVLRTLLRNHIQGFAPDIELVWLAPLFFVGLAGIVLGGLELKSSQRRRSPTAEDINGSMADSQRIRPSDSSLHPNRETEQSGRQRATAAAGTVAGWRRMLIILSWLFLPIVLIHGLSLRQPVFVDRYIIWIGPAALLIVAVGMAVVWHNAYFVSKPLTFLLFIYMSGFWLNMDWQQKQIEIKYDLRSAVSTVAEQRRLDELLILQIPHMEYSYRYYSSNQGSYPFVGSTERLGRWMGGLWTNNGQPDDLARSEVAAHMERVTDGLKRIWVIRSEVEMWDARHLMDEWLDLHATLVEQWNFHGSQVRLYELR